MSKRSPVLGFNHNLRYRGVLFHIQTEDSGPSNPHIFTHVFHGGTILSTRKQVYDASADVQVVKNIMQSQHKLLMKELRKGSFDAKIDQSLSHLPELLPAGAPLSVDEEHTERISSEEVAVVHSAAPPSAPETPGRAARSEYSMGRRRGSSVSGIAVDRIDGTTRRPGSASGSPDARPKRPTGPAESSRLARPSIIEPSSRSGRHAALGPTPAGGTPVAAAPQRSGRYAAVEPPSAAPPQTAGAQGQRIDPRSARPSLAADTTARNARPSLVPDIPARARRAETGDPGRTARPSIAGAVKSLTNTGPAPILRPRPPTAPPIVGGRPRAQTMQRLPRAGTPSGQSPTFVVKGNQATPAGRPQTNSLPPNPPPPRPGAPRAPSMPPPITGKRPQTSSQSSAGDKTLDDVILSFLNEDDKKSRR